MYSIHSNGSITYSFGDMSEYEYDYRYFNNLLISAFDTNDILFLHLLYSDKKASLWYVNKKLILFSKLMFVGHYSRSINLNNDE